MSGGSPDRSRRREEILRLLQIASLPAIVEAVPSHMWGFVG
jgi:hypothetical protein